MISTKLLQWYDEHKRDLPWRDVKNPYYTWVSEIMLQQTQVQTVIPYFLRFIDLFPTIHDLANADEETLLAAWEGLGYYSRARNLQAAAKMIEQDFGGVFPDQYAAILSLKGIGPYTAGAIASIAFDQKVPAVDGNALRVYTRLFALEDNISAPKTVKKVGQLIEDTMSSSRPGDFNQALMDLGSGVCTPKNYQCESCPLQTECKAYRLDKVSAIPYKKPKPKPVDVYYIALALQSAQTKKYYLEKRPDKGLLAKFNTFPLIEITKDEYDAIKEEQSAEVDLFKVAEDNQWLAKLPQRQNVIWQTAPQGEVTHVFSHRKWHVLLAYGYDKAPVNEGMWLGRDEIDTVPFPKIQHKLWDLLARENH